MAWRIFVAGAAICGSVLCLAAAHAAAPAANRAAPVNFTPAPGVRATARQVDAGHIGLRLQPGGPEARFDVDTESRDENTQPRFEVADFNFDGHPDVAFITMVGMVNEDYAIYLYDPAQQRFARLPVPSGKGLPRGACDGLWSVTTSAPKHTLYSACRGGPSWFTDAYRYQPDGRLYLYEAPTDVPPEVDALLDATPEGGPSRLVATYDPAGHVLARHVEAYDGSPAMLTVNVERLPLHDKPAAGPSRRYLVDGDSAAVSDITADGRWVQLRYRSERKGTITGWVDVRQADPDAGADSGR